jgi:hypothetical protein
MLVRMSPSHVRFGSFEYFYHRNEFEYLPVLADHVIAEHFPDLSGRPDRYVAFFGEVIARTARLIADWQAVGFAHGVMNSDNMSIVGVTLDYGPFGFLDAYDPGFICNHSDHYGRYAFDKQPDIGLFNLHCLGQALLPLFSPNPQEAGELALAELKKYADAFQTHYFERMRAKLGFETAQPNDAALMQSLLSRLAKNRVDYTRFFRALCRFSTQANEPATFLRDEFIEHEGFDAWAYEYTARLKSEASQDAERRTRMEKANPKYILRNYLAEAAIRKAQDEKDYSEIETLHRLLRRPFDEQPEMEVYAAPPPEWAQRLSVSCSS